MQGFAGLCVPYAVVFVSLGGADMKNNMNEMFTKRFGIEIEMTGITKEKASKIVAETVNGTVHYEGGMYDKRTITLPNSLILLWLFYHSLLSMLVCFHHLR